jgi:hypothetical protein
MPGAMPCLHGDFKLMRCFNDVIHDAEDLSLRFRPSGDEGLIVCGHFVRMTTRIPDICMKEQEVQEVVTHKMRSCFDNSDNETRTDRIRISTASSKQHRSRKSYLNSNFETFEHSTSLFLLLTSGALD